MQERRTRLFPRISVLSLPLLLSCSATDRAASPGRAQGGDESPHADAGAPSSPLLPDGSAIIAVGCGTDCLPPRHCSLGPARCLDEGACIVDADCADGQKCNSSGACEVGGGCGQTSIQIEKIPPNIMILLDRSGSMNGDAGGDTRWNVAKAAIDKM